MKKRNLVILFAALFILITLLIIRETNNNQINKGLTLEELRSLPYLTHTKENADKTKRGIVKYDPELAFEGYNLYGCDLMDMEGNIVYSLPNFCILFGIILEEGNIIAIWKEEDKTIGKYNLNSSTIWEKNITVHHEISLSPNNTILTLSKEIHEYNGRKVEFDLIIELSQDGQELSRWSTYENFDYIKKFHEPSKLDQPINIYIYNEDKEEVYDYYHLNSIQALPETTIGKKDNRFQAGNWLLSFCYVNLIVILDKETKEIVWSWGSGELERQHSPTMLDNGNILIYDNGFYNRSYTRIIEINPIKKEIVWEYKTNPPELFFSEAQGYAQRLPNENTLITDSENGRVFEITKEGEIVWEWFHPAIDEEGKRKTLYRMVRYPKDKIDKLLELDKK